MDTANKYSGPFQVTGNGHTVIVEHGLGTQNVIYTVITSEGYQLIGPWSVSYERDRLVFNLLFEGDEVPANTRIVVIG